MREPDYRIENIKIWFYPEMKYEVRYSAVNIMSYKITEKDGVLYLQNAQLWYEMQLLYKDYMKKLNDEVDEILLEEKGV